MVNGWPDAVKCTASNGGTALFYLDWKPSSGDVFYSTPYDSNAYPERIRFTSAGAFSAQDITNSWTVTDCNKSISQLYADGQAFNFIGNSGAGGGSALGDRITSGTLAVTANSSTAIVSLSTNGTTWGYLGSTASYLPTLNTSAISATAVQISSNTAVTCGAGNAGTLRYNSSNTALELCTGSGWQVMGVGIPAGTISAFASTTCPTGWSEYTPARGRFLRGIDNGAGNDPDGTRTPGGTQFDAFQGAGQDVRFGGSLGQPRFSLNAGAGSQYNLSYGGGGNTNEFIGTTASYYDIGYGTPRPSAETRPKNVAVTFCQFNGTSNGWNNPLSGGSTVPGGNTGQIQFNSAGAFAGSAGLTWDNAASRLTATNISATSLTVNGVPVTGSAATDRLVSGSNVLRLSNSASLDLLTTGEARLNVLGGANSNASVELGNGRTGNGFSYIDLVGDTTYSDYGLRLIRDNAGPNANSWLQHRGTGGLNLMTVESAPITFTTNSTERMRVLANGNVGVGATAPAAPLVVAGTTTARAIAQGQVALGHISETNWNGNGIIFTNSNQNGTQGVTHRSIVQNSGNLHIGRHTSSGSTSDLMISEYGFVGLGGVWPASPFSVYNQFAPVIQLTEGETGGQAFIGVDGNDFFIRRGSTANPDALRIQPSGNIVTNYNAFKPGGGSWADSSDARLKANVRPITGALDKLTRLNGVDFEWKMPKQHHGDTTPGGFVAQNVREVFPEFVKAEDCKGEECKLVDDGKILTLGLPLKFDAYVVEAMKELKAENEALKAANDNHARELQAIREEIRALKEAR